MERTTNVTNGTAKTTTMNMVLAAMFLAGAFLNAVPGIVAQIILIPIIIITLKRARVVE